MTDSGLIPDSTTHLVFPSFRQFIFTNFSVQMTASRNAFIIDKFQRYFDDLSDSAISIFALPLPCVNIKLHRSQCLISLPQFYDSMEQKHNTLRDLHLNDE